MEEARRGPLSSPTINELMSEAGEHCQEQLYCCCMYDRQLVGKLFYFRVIF